MTKVSASSRSASAPAADQSGVAGAKGAPAAEAATRTCFADRPPARLDHAALEVVGPDLVEPGPVEPADKAAEAVGLARGRTRGGGLARIAAVAVGDDLAEPEWLAGPGARPDAGDAPEAVPAPDGLDTPGVERLEGLPAGVGHDERVAGVEGRRGQHAPEAVVDAREGRPPEGIGDRDEASLDVVRVARDRDRRRRARGPGDGLVAVALLHGDRPPEGVEGRGRGVCPGVRPRGRPGRVGATGVVVRVGRGDLPRGRRARRAEGHRRLAAVRPDAAHRPPQLVEAHHLLRPRQVRDRRISEPRREQGLPALHHLPLVVVALPPRDQDPRRCSRRGRGQRDRAGGAAVGGSPTAVSSSSSSSHGRAAGSSGPARRSIRPSRPRGRARRRAPRRSRGGAVAACGPRPGPARPRRAAMKGAQVVRVLDRRPPRVAVALAPFDPGRGEQAVGGVGEELAVAVRVEPARPPARRRDRSQRSSRGRRGR